MAILDHPGAGPKTPGQARRDLITSTAIETLAGRGMRGLTHRAVDQAAGLPAGSTSYYFRTREALLQATVERLADSSLADLAALSALGESGPLTAPVLADTVTGVLSHWLTAGRSRLIARYELSLEAIRRPGLRDVLVTTGAGLRAAAAGLLARAGAPDPQPAAARLTACLDGLLFDQVAGAGQPLTPAELHTAVRGLLRIALEG